jgi:hypothetical protein
VALLLGRELRRGPEESLRALIEKVEETPSPRSGGRVGERGENEEKTGENEE